MSQDKICCHPSRTFFYWVISGFFWLPMALFCTTLREDPTATDTGEPKTPFLLGLKRVSLKHRGEDRCVGSMTRYSTLDLLFGAEETQGSLPPLLILQGHSFEHQKYGATVGTAYRYLSPSWDQILGMNLFYDYREGFQSHFHQIGVGLEIVGSRWDLRANGYIPLGQKTGSIVWDFDSYGDGFVIQNTQTELAGSGYNLAFGWMVVRSKSFLLHSSVGAYYVPGSLDDKTLGWEFRIRPQFHDYFGCDLRWSYDPIFHAVFQLELFVTLPLYQLQSRSSRSRVTGRELYQPVERFDTVPLVRHSCWSYNW